MKKSASGLSLLKQAQACKNPRLKKDLLKVFLFQKNYQKKARRTLNQIGVQKENPLKLRKVIRALKKNPRVHVAADLSSVYYKKRSPACTACGSGFSNTQRITQKCNRNCFFCFANPDPLRVKNQVNLSAVKKGILQRNQRQKIHSFAISGGEPFLYPQKVYELLAHVNSKYKHCRYTRIYTNGDFVTEAILKKLQKLNLDEIRFSIKPFEKPRKQILRLSSKHIPRVLVEMPILPKTEQYMRTLIKELENLGVSGINLMELFFNGHHLKEYQKRKYKIDLEELRNFYSTREIYQYPVFGSKLLALKLIHFFSQKNYRPFLHFCSLGKRRQIIYKEQRLIAQNNQLPYSQLTSQNTHKFLALYGNLDQAQKILKKHKLRNFFLRKERNYPYRLETTVASLKYFRQPAFFPVFVERSTPNTFDINLDLIKT